MQTSLREFLFGATRQFWSGTNDMITSTRKALWLTMLTIGFLSAMVAAGLVCLEVFERRHPGAMRWQVGVGYVGYLGFWVLVYAFWIWRIGREHRWKWLVLLFMAHYTVLNTRSKQKVVCIGLPAKRLSQSRDL